MILLTSFQGVVGAMMNTGFQLGTTVGVASQCSLSSRPPGADTRIRLASVVSTAITIGVNNRAPVQRGPEAQLKGYAVSFWSILGLHVLEIIMTGIFVK
jgi:hypothetical protein